MYGKLGQMPVRSPELMWHGNITHLDLPLGMMGMFSKVVHQGFGVGDAMGRDKIGIYSAVEN